MTESNHANSKIDFEPEDRDKNAGQSAITVSKTAYAALSALKKNVDDAKGDFVAFPDGTWIKGQVVTELTKKGAVQKRGSHRSAVFNLAVEFDSVRESGRASKGSSHASKASASRHVHPAGRGRSLPTVSQMNSFLAAVDKEAKELSHERATELKQKIADLKKQLSSAEGDVEARLIRELHQANEERHTLAGRIEIDAVKNVSAEAQYRAFAFMDLLSTDPEDYR